MILLEVTFSINSRVVMWLVLLAQKEADAGFNEERLAHGSDQGWVLGIFDIGC